MANKTRTPIDLEVEAVFNTYPKQYRTKLLFLRKLVLDTAASIPGIGKIEETLKWGEPSYLTPESKSGSTIRIAWKESQKEQYSVFFKCTANLVPAFIERFPDLFNYSGNRSIDFKIEDEIPIKELKLCIAMALTYHKNKELDNQARWEMIENYFQK